MTLSSDISTTSTALSDIKTAIIAKGVTPSGNITTYATAISNIPSGGGIGIPREVKNGVYQMPTTNFTFSLPSNATNVGKYGLYYAFRDCTALTSVDLSSLTTVSGTQGLYYAFTGCTALTSVDLSSLTTVSGSKCLSSAFNGCTGLTDIYFRALTTSSFGSYKNQFDSMLSSTGSTKTHTIHFPSNLQSKISSLTGYPNFGGTSGYVTLSFDLPATSYFKEKINVYHTSL